MLHQLLETGRTTQRSRAGTMVSVMVHVAVIGAVLQLSHVVPAAALTAPEAVPVHFQPLEPTPAPPVYRARSASGAPGLPGPVVLTAPTTISVDIPPVNLGAALIDANVFDTSRPVTPGGRGTEPGAGVPGGAPMTGLEVDKPAAAIPGAATPAYPDGLKASGVEGEALVRFVVDTLGRAEVGTFQVLEASHEAFGAAVRAALPRMRFLPAESGGRKVRMLVQQRFAFALER